VLKIRNKIPGKEPNEDEETEVCQIMNAAEKVCHELFMAEGRGIFN